MLHGVQSFFRESTKNVSRYSPGGSRNSSINIAGGKRSSQRLVTDTTGTLSSDEEYTTKEINDLVDVLLAQDYW